MGTVYLIPSLLAGDATDTIPLYVTDAIKNCQVFFVENERTTRRYFKTLWKACLPGQEIVIDDYEWFVMPGSPELSGTFKQKLKEGKTIGIVSEAGCPGVADPGQFLIAIAQEMNADVRPLAGPNSILLALMGSGMNGQRFQFTGYLPVDSHQRIKAIRELEAESALKNCTQIFIETPYRNNQLFEAIIQHCRGTTRLCIAANLTAKNEMIKTRTISSWKTNVPQLHKQPVIFCLNASAEALT